jgi:hypothetical protein
MYNVVLLIEQELADIDADQVISLHEGVDDRITYHLLLPVASSAVALSASMTAFGSGEVIAPIDPDTMRHLQDDYDEMGQKELDASAELLRSRKQTVTEKLVEGDPIYELDELVQQVSADEVIILTEPHLVSEFLKLDWTSRARRRFDVPTLHLLEHLPFSAQTEL